MTNNLMKALILQSYDKKEFKTVEMPVPVAGKGEVLVKIHASGVNPIDYKIRSGLSPYAMPELPAVLGTDMAGEVISVGEGVTGFKPGDRVYGLTGGVKGLQGSLAEYAAVDASLIAIQPANLTHHEAAALPLVFLTAWEGLVDNARIKAGDKVLVQGGAGGVGHMAVQLARALGAEVYATASSPKQQLLKALGANAYDYSKTSVSELTAEATGGKGFDIIYDTVGGETLNASFDAIKYYGHITSCAAFGKFDLTSGSLRCATISGVFVLLPMLTGNQRKRHGEILQQLTQLVEAGKVKPIIDPRHFSLDSVLDAHDAVEDGSASIKVVIDIV